MPRASLVYLRDRKGWGRVGWSSPRLGSGGEQRRGKAAGQWEEREGETWREEGRDGGMDVR